MKVAIVGTGNVAHILGLTIKKSGHTILQVTGRNQGDTFSLAAQLDATPNTDFDAITSEADIHMIAVSDSAVQAVAHQLPRSAGIVVHTAGSVSKEVLKGTAASYGVLYPLQSLRSDRPDVSAIPLLIDANTPAALQQLQIFAATLSPTVSHATDDARVQLHIGRRSYQQLYQFSFYAGAGFLQQRKS